MTSRRFDGVLFDLLTALLDSWTLWNDVAGDEATGRRWRGEYLRSTYATGRYRPYEAMVAEAAEAVGLRQGAAEDLAARYGELRPWPGVPEALRALADDGVRLGVVTNCSEQLGRIATGCVGVPFDVIVTAERAGFYKPDPTPYLLGVQELGVEPSRCLFVAGSPFDLIGTARAGLPTFWHDRSGMEPPEGAQPPLARHTTLAALPDFVRGKRP